MKTILTLTIKFVDKNCSLKKNWKSEPLYQMVKNQKHVFPNFQESMWWFKNDVRDLSSVLNKLISTVVSYA